jgi:hypothetical protein
LFLRGSPKPSRGFWIRFERSITFHAIAFGKHPLKWSDFAEHTQSRSINTPSFALWQSTHGSHRVG